MLYSVNKLCLKILSGNLDSREGDDLLMKTSKTAIQAQRDCIPAIKCFNRKKTVLYVEAECNKLMCLFFSPDQYWSGHSPCFPGQAGSQGPAWTGWEFPASQAPQLMKAPPCFVVGEHPRMCKDEGVCVKELGLISGVRHPQEPGMCCQTCKSSPHCKCQMWLLDLVFLT